MQEIFFFILTVLAAALVGVICYKLHLPAGAMVGAMIGAVAFNLITDSAVFYPKIKVGIQVFSGALIGSRMGREDVASMKKIIIPIVMLVLSMVVLNVSFGGTIYRLSSLDLPTSLFAVTPAGASDMAIIASDLGANTAYVAILQLFRLIVIFSCMPPIFKKLIARIRKKEAAQSGGAAQTVAAKKLPLEPKRLIALILSAAAGGMALYFAGVTAGAMIGGMLGGMAYCIIRGKVYYPKPLRVTLQILSGAYIGMQLDRSSLSTMGDLLIPMAVMLVGILIFVFVVSFIIHKVTKLSLVTCLLASTPGGIQEMSLLADELGADTPKVAIMQTARLVFVISFFPAMLQLIIKFFG